MTKKTKEPKVKIGDRFDKLEVLKQVEIPINRRVKDEYGNSKLVKTDKTKVGWLCKCDCGNKIEIAQDTLLTPRSSLRSCNQCPAEKNLTFIPKGMTFEENQEWNELYNYVKNNVLKYKQDLPNYMVARLQGLQQGKYMANNKTVNNANYSYKVVLNAFKLCFLDIQRALNSNNFKDEQHKFNYIAKIVEPKINDVYIRMKRVEQQKEDIKNDDKSAMLEYVNMFNAEEDDDISNSAILCDESLW